MLRKEWKRRAGRQAGRQAGGWGGSLFSPRYLVESRKTKLGDIEELQRARCEVKERRKEERKE
ncbi:hypothetical protein E2C01_023121 [Portunus trituberculatus]|uniref:Uncharacterized protein n=1 Tax=Portunus trituberculatus TaxID=210409 RepID=A0A5B7E8W3_PORTR|nr:hypothetical protein [Portunus trituberculatus]